MESTRATTTAGGKTFALEFPLAPEPIGQETLGGGFDAAPGVHASLVEDGARAILSLVAVEGSLVSLAFPDADDVAVDAAQRGFVSWGDETLSFSVEGGEARATLGGFEVEILSTVASVEFSQGGLEAMALDGSGIVYVPSTRRPPEFSIGVFDDAAFKRPRPVRLGVPVVSTVPVNGPALSAADLETLLLGEGTPSRVAYFRVVSSEAIPADVTPSLLVSLPNGLDTVAAPVRVALAKSTLDSGAKRTVYTGWFEFHREDAVRWVDGFAYLSVDLPVRVATALPFEIQVTPTGTAFAAPSLDDPTVY